MSVFDPILQGLLGGHTNAGPLQGIIGSIMGGGQAPQTGVLGGLFGGGHQQPPPQQQPGYGAPAAGGGMGGLMGLIDQFRGAGLGNVADSWVGTGQNQPVSPQQLQQVFGQDRINQWAQQSGMSQPGFLGALSQYLPQAVDRATPNGRLDDSFGNAGNPFEGPGVQAPGGSGAGGKSYKKPY